MLFKTFREYVADKEKCCLQNDDQKAVHQKYCLVREMAARKQLGRIVDIAKDPERMAVIISASRRGKEVFKGATKSLENDIRSRGYKVAVKQGGSTTEVEKELPGEGPVGITPTHGGYPEGGIDVREKSLFVSMPRGQQPPPDEEIVDFFVTLAEKYQQWGVIIKLPGEESAHEYTTRHHDDMGPGRRIPYNAPHAEDEPMYYTRPRYRGMSKKPVLATGDSGGNEPASDRDALVYEPDFDNPQRLPFDRPYGKKD